MRVATLNAHDRSKPVRRSLELAGIVLWQEFPRTPVRELFAGTGWSAAGGAGDVVTGWRLRWWEYLGSTWHVAHDGRKRVTPRRGTLVTRLRHRNGLELLVLNGHRINRTRGRWLAVPWVHARWRARRWEDHDRLDRQLVEQAIANGARLIMYGGDWNRRHVAPLHSQARRITTPAAIDQLWLIDLDDQLAVGRHDTIRRTGSDHALRRAWLRYKKGR